jgi:hypothetical protein
MNAQVPSASEALKSSGERRAGAPEHLNATHDRRILHQLVENCSHFDDASVAPVMVRPARVVILGR